LIRGLILGDFQIVPAFYAMSLGLAIIFSPFILGEIIDFIVNHCNQPQQALTEAQIAQNTRTRIRITNVFRLCQLGLFIYICGSSPIVG
jgi:hypothetical protein